MVGILYCVISFVAAAWGARRSVGHGLAMVFASGYFYGFIRGRWYDGITQLGFDAALLGFYLAYFSQPLSAEVRARQRDIMPWFGLLVGWPCFVMLYTPALPQAQTIVGQLAGLHSIALYFPMLLVGTHLRRKDLDFLAPAFAILNLCTLPFAVLEYLFGLEAVIPRNASTELAYISQDIEAGGQTYQRIVACFVDSHLYAFVMLLTLSLLVHGLELGRRRRLLCVAGILAAVIGIFLAGARSPVVCLGVATIAAFGKLRVRPSTWLALGVLGLIIGFLVVGNERLQRLHVRDRHRGARRRRTAASTPSRRLTSSPSTRWGSASPPRGGRASPASSRA